MLARVLPAGLLYLPPANEAHPFDAVSLEPQKGLFIMYEHVLSTRGGEVKKFTEKHREKCVCGQEEPSRIMLMCANG